MQINIALNLYLYYTDNAWYALKNCTKVKTWVALFISDKKQGNGLTLFRFGKERKKKT